MPDLKLFRRGKVRDVYDLDDSLLIVTTDRVSAFDCVLPNGLPGKGKLLTAISLFWFEFIGKHFPHHLISANVEEYPEYLQKYKNQLEGRSMLVKKARLLEVECIVRGYITGSGWKEYCRDGSVCNIPLPEGLQKSQKLEAPLFTPSTKADVGHDENISFEESAKIVGLDKAEKIKEASLFIYQEAAKYALSRGIILCDTKFEFGEYEGEIILIDEVLTPDSSRFWDKEKYVIGQENDSFDKQIVRNYLDSLDWNKTDPAPPLSEDTVQKTLDRYEEIIDRLMS
ncbi:phosphoribosylaminoimidazolesuccinocarboxamide synthase [PVC group bacterium (ex Bugula neritina AB1)]|nr:phosphoribosylaminoimidazolesuccinocarboxamide synthase [PVC group bacterium (ex Bugula neritina AB1)]